MAVGSKKSAPTGHIHGVTMPFFEVECAWWHALHFAVLPRVSSTLDIDGARHGLPHRVRIETFSKLKCVWHVWEH
jgi:hypothetical protein